MRKAKQTSTQPAIDLGAELLTSVREMKAGIRARVHRPEISAVARGRAFSIRFRCTARCFRPHASGLGARPPRTLWRGKDPLSRCRAPS